MEDNYPIEDVVHYLNSERFLSRLAKDIGVNPNTPWLTNAHKGAYNIALTHASNLKRENPQGIPKSYVESLIETIVNLIKTEHEKRKLFISKNYMMSQDQTGTHHAHPAISLNEDSKNDDKRRVFELLSQHGVIQRLKNSFEGSQHEFRSTLGVAFYFVYSRFSRRKPIADSDVEQMEIELRELFQNADDTSLFKSSTKASGSKIPTHAGDDPFESGSFTNIGLNESTEWTEAKIKRLIKSEIESHIKKEKYLTEKEIKDLVRKAIVRLFKFLWEKSSFFINQI